MAWCPNCKAQYREGITTCADCKIDLVDALPEDATNDVSIDPDDELENTITPSLTARNSLTYVKKEDRYKDLKSTAYIFLAFGIFGLIFVVLNILNIFTFLTTWVQFIVLSGVCIAFIIIAIHSYIRSKEILPQINHEHDLTKQINAWLKEHMTKATLAHFDESNTSPEIIFLKKAEYMRAKLKEEFDVVDEVYLDQLIEDYYNEYLEV